MTFGTRIALAMAGTVLVAMVVVSIAGGTTVRRSYLDALRGSLEARIDAVEQQRVGMARGGGERQQNEHCRNGFGHDPILPGWRRL